MDIIAFWTAKAGLAVFIIEYALISGAYFVQGKPVDALYFIGALILTVSLLLR